MKKTKSSKGKTIVSIASLVAMLLVVVVAVVLAINSQLNKTPVDVPATETTATSVTTETETTVTTTTTTAPNPDTPPEPEPDPSFTITLSFAGDTVFSDVGSFAHHAATQDAEYFFEKVRPIFEADDFTIVNFESVLTDRDLTQVEKDYTPAFWFKSPTSNVEILSSGGVDGVLLSNNHIMDYGQEGYADTVAALTEAGLQYGDHSRTMYFEKNGFTVAVICSGLWGEYQTTRIINCIKTAESQSDYQVVFFHGGEEKIHAPEEWKQNAARTLVDNGADLVIGSHPHVLQPREVYNGVDIVYSIGNFCYAGNRYPENRTVIYQMELTINGDLTLQSAQSTIIPCYVYTGDANNYQPAVVEDNEEIKNEILDFMDGKIESPV